MNDKNLYERILGINRPWLVSDVVMDISANTITVKVNHTSGTRFCCPVCNTDCAIHDHRMRRWRHLPTCHMRTVIEADVPRVLCTDHGVKQVPVPWADSNSSFTALFEALAIRWLQEASLTAVSRLMDITWDQADGIRSRAVKRGLVRRKQQPVKSIGVDETSFKKKHDYVTVVTDRSDNTVLEVLDGRSQSSLQDYFSSMEADRKSAVETITMDMWYPYIAAVRNTFEHWYSLVCFDRFHVAQHFSKALDKVRASEHNDLRQKHSDSILTRTRYAWLKNSSHVDNRSRRWFMNLTRASLKTARAWAIKETAAGLWAYVYRGSAGRAWQRLISWMRRCRLPAMAKLGKTIRSYLWGILNAIIAQVTNGGAESVNSRIQWIKKTACGFRNRQRFKHAILFHLGGLDLISDKAKLCHTIC